ncbi:glycosyltransferase [Leuconostoc citreum]|uniref:glycosyltransferase n=1 Tax=Leuconostoc citreum TaxID=33964 RepID=UPI000C29434A|nr:glycosyltransferase [Leuconostoc citreum]
MRKNVNRIGILIPSLNPDQKLVQLVKKLLDSQLFNENIVIIDDGSEDQTIFSKLEYEFREEIKIIHHSQNLGKGAALKTGFNFFLTNNKNISGIATLDSDGQHTVTDLKKCIALFEQYPNDLIIGSRNFSKEIPFRSRFGNILTNELVHIIARLKISDTQTGLRVIPLRYVKKLLNFSGRRFEFEFDMLLKTKQYGIAIHEEPIDTIYINDNGSSHFRVIRDSIAIYFEFIKFAASGLVSFLLDIILFASCISLMQRTSLQGIMFATIFSRCISAAVNYGVNRYVVFNRVGSAVILKYFILVMIQMLISGYLTNILATEIFISGDSTFLITVFKIVIDFVLFLISYQIQKRLIFSKKEQLT